MIQNVNDNVGMNYGRHMDVDIRDIVIDEAGD